MRRKTRHRPIALILVACVVSMLGVAYASVPLYRLFCSATGYGGTTQRVSAAPVEVKDRWITVSFDSNVDANLPWDFGPNTPQVRVKLGEITTVTFHAHNRGTIPLVGMATFNVQPDKAGSYFDKIQCFCFNRQVLEPGQSAEMPVQFYIDPALADDHQSDDVTNITLSYTLFRAKDQNMATGNIEKKS